MTGSVADNAAPLSCAQPPLIRRRFVEHLVRMLGLAIGFAIILISVSVLKTITGAVAGRFPDEALLISIGGWIALLALVLPIDLAVITILLERIGVWRAIGPGLMTMDGYSGRLTLHLQMDCYPRLWERNDERGRKLIVLERVLRSLRELREDWLAGRLHQNVVISVQASMLAPDTMDDLGFIEDTKTRWFGWLKRPCERYVTKFLWAVGRRTPARVSSKEWGKARWELSNISHLNEDAVREKLEKVRVLLERLHAADQPATLRSCAGNEGARPERA